MSDHQETFGRDIGRDIAAFLDSLEGGARDIGRDIAAFLDSLEGGARDIGRDIAAFLDSLEGGARCTFTHNGLQCQRGAHEHYISHYFDL